MPAIADMAAWEKVIKGRAGTRWDSVVEKVWKDLGGNQEEILSIEEFGGFKTKVNERIETQSKASAKKQAEKGGTPTRRVERRYRNENVFARPNGLRENAETTILSKGPQPSRKKKEVYR